MNEYLFGLFHDVLKRNLKVFIFNIVSNCLEKRLKLETREHFLLAKASTRTVIMNCGMQTEPSSSLIRRHRVNENLVRLQSSRDSNTNLSVLDTDNEGDYDDDAVLSQVIPGQQFFQDTDSKLMNLTSEEYIKELINVCTNENSKLLLYREHLLERVRSLPDCPPGRLVARKNTNKCSKTVKYARDCYILHKFTQGERSGDIYDVLGGNPSLNDSTMLLTDRQIPNSETERVVREPDTTAILLRIQSDVDQIKHKSEHCERLLMNLSDSFEQVKEVQKHLETEMTKIISNDCKRIHNDSLGDVQRQLREIFDNTKVIISKCHENIPKSNENVANVIQTGNTLSQDNETEIVSDASMVINSLDVTKATADDQTDGQTSGTDLTVPINVEENDKTAPLPEKNSNKSLYSDKVKSHKTKTTSFANDKTNKHQDRTNSVDREHSGSSEKDNGGFVAYTRKKKSTFYVGNIDPNVTYKDVYDFMQTNKLKASSINIYYGKSAASLKFNLPNDQIHIAEKDGFWPENLRFRRWKTKAEWENEKRAKFAPRYHSYVDRHEENEQSGFKASRKKLGSKSYGRFRNDYREDYNETHLHKSYSDDTNRHNHWADNYDTWDDELDSCYNSRP